MAITLGTTGLGGSQGGVASSTLTLSLGGSFTAGRLVLVHIAIQDTTVSVSSITDDTTGGPMVFTKFYGNNNGTSVRHELWMTTLTGSVAGGSFVTITFTGSTHASATLQEWDGPQALGNISIVVNSGTNPSVSVTTQDANNVVAAGFSTSDASTPTAGTGTLDRAINSGGTPAVSSAATHNTSASPAAVTNSVTHGTTHWIAVAVELRTVATVPVNTPDWPNPRATVRPVGLLTWLFHYSFDGTPPIQPIDWPNPSPVAYANALRAAPVSVPVVLQQQGAGAQPFGTSDFPNPRPATYPVSLRTLLGHYSFDPNGNPQPFSQGDWPNPRGASFPIVNRFASVNILETTLQIVQVKPFTQTDWPVPLAKARQNVSQLGFLSYYVGDYSSPFTQNDWPNPRGASFPPELRTWLQTTVIALPVAPKPFTQGDWPNPQPKGYPIELRTFLTIDNATTTLNPVSPAPFSALDWPVPKGALFPIGLRTFAGAMYQVAGQDTFFGGSGEPLVQGDWPVPTRAGFPVDLLKSYPAYIPLVSSRPTPVPFLTWAVVPPVITWVEIPPLTTWRVF